MPKKMEIEFEENKKKIEKLEARQKDLEMRMKARTNYKKRKERTHKMCLLAGDIEKIFINTYAEKFFDTNFESKRNWLINVFFRNCFENFTKTQWDYMKLQNEAERIQQLLKEKSQNEIKPDPISQTEKIGELLEDDTDDFDFDLSFLEGDEDENFS